MGNSNNRNSKASEERHGMQRWLDSDANRRKALEIRREKLDREAKQIERRGGGAGRRR